MQYALYVLLGIGLAAACGFRVFVPFLVISIAALAGHLRLAPDFAWLGSWPALIIFGVATLLEIVAYYVPWLDHLLDIAATPVAIVAGIVVTASVVTGMSPVLRWSLAAIAGGGVAAAIQLATVALRRASTYATAGLAHPLAATLETGGSVGMSILSLLLPFVAGLLAIILILIATHWLLRHRARA
ncbi:MAG TPA: DUF4126 domain-containing protein [bacterium]|nr:DUF4126 domain-containing protein [bacterium]